LIWEVNMNIAIIGKSKINGKLKKHLADEGFIPLLFDNTSDIKGFSGEKGRFVIRTEKNNIEAGYIIVTDEAASGKALLGGTLQDVQVQALSTFNNMDNLRDKKGPVVILLDFPYESSVSMTGLALEKSIKLARKQKKVVCLARFMRTGEKELELLYKEARNQGVTFIKYNTIALDYSEDEDVFHIEAADDFGNYAIDTRTLAAADSEVPGESFGRTAKLLRLKLDEGGFLSKDSYFMYPSLTNRKGVYYLNESINVEAEDELLARVKYIAAEIKSEYDESARFNTPCSKALKLPAIFPDALPPLQGAYAEIDAGKCAFCYTCFRACPHSAMAPDYENSVMKNLKSSCYACGICVSVCPGSAIKISAGKNPAEEAASKTLEILCCENSGEIAVKRLAGDLGDKFGEIIVTPAACGGEINVNRIISALKHVGKVLVVTCMDEACRHFEGNRRASKQVEKARELLKASGMDENRVECISVSHAMPYVLKDYITQIIG